MFSVLDQTNSDNLEFKTPWLTLATSIHWRYKSSTILQTQSESHFLDKIKIQKQNVRNHKSNKLPVVMNSALSLLSLVKFTLGVYLTKVDSEPGELRTWKSQERILTLTNHKKFNSQMTRLRRFTPVGLLLIVNQPKWSSLKEKAKVHHRMKKKSMMWRLKFTFGVPYLSESTWSSIPQSTQFHKYSKNWTHINLVNSI